MWFTPSSTTSRSTPIERSRGEKKKGGEGTGSSRIARKKRGGKEPQVERYGPGLIKCYLQEKEKERGGGGPGRKRSGPTRPLWSGGLPGHNKKKRKKKKKKKKKGPGRLKNMRKEKGQLTPWCPRHPLAWRKKKRGGKKEKKNREAPSISGKEKEERDDAGTKAPSPFHRSARGGKQKKKKKLLSVCLQKRGKGKRGVVKPPPG